MKVKGYKIRNHDTKIMFLCPMKKTMPLILGLILASLVLPHTPTPPPFF